MEERETGTVKWFNNRKGYGFITRDAGGDVFVHYSSLTEQEGFRSLEEGARVEYQIEEREKGPAAIDVRKL
jgi:CspA family cold shock protein